MVAIGASTGGPKAVAAVLTALPAALDAGVLVAQHMDMAFSSDLAAWLNTQTSLSVALAETGGRPTPGRVHVAIPGKQLALSAVHTYHYLPEPIDSLYRPCIDIVFESLARSCLPPGVAVLLTGMGADGAAGLLALKNRGWFTIAQDESTSAVYGMPKAAKELGAANLVLPLPFIGASVLKHLRNL
jgi:two-component system response regulator WspF